MLAGARLADGKSSILPGVGDSGPAYRNNPAKRRPVVQV